LVTMYMGHMIWAAELYKAKNEKNSAIKQIIPQFKSYSLIFCNELL